MLLKKGGCWDGKELFFFLVREVFFESYRNMYTESCLCDEILGVKVIIVDHSMICFFSEGLNVSLFTYKYCLVFWP